MEAYHKVIGILVWSIVKFWNFFHSPRWKPVGRKCQGQKQTGLTLKVLDWFEVCFGSVLKLSCVCVLVYMCMCQYACPLPAQETAGA